MGGFLAGIQAVKAFPDSPRKLNYVAREIIKVDGAHIITTDVHGGRFADRSQRHPRTCLVAAAYTHFSVDNASRQVCTHGPS